MRGLYFDDSEEPNDFQFDFKKSIEKIMEDEGTEYLKIETDNQEDYYKILDELLEFNKNAFKITSSSKEDDLTIEVENTHEAS